MDSKEIGALVHAVEGCGNDTDAFAARLTAGQWQRLAGALERVALQPGQLLLRHGDSERCAYLVESGDLQVFVTGGRPRSHRVATLRAGTMVGEGALFAAAPRLAHVEAVAPCVLWKLPAERLPALAHGAPALVTELLRAAGALLSARLRAHVERGIPVA